MSNLEIEKHRSGLGQSAQALGPVATVGTFAWLKNQVAFEVPVWAVCLNCDHSKLHDAAELLALVESRSADLPPLADRMRCRACGGKACEFRAATPVPEYC